MTTARDDLEQRILLRTATTKDAVMASAVLERAGILSHASTGIDNLIEEMERGAGALLIAEEVLKDPSAGLMLEALRAQAEWSDLPVLLLARQGADSRAIANAMEEIVNVVVIERPMRIAALVSAARTALRSRNRQYALRKLVEDLRIADERKTEFLATLAHELRNPLAPLKNALDLLMRKKLDATDPTRFYEMMMRQVDHMVRLINDLMEVSRITRGKIAIDLAPISLSTVIADAVELSRPVIEAAGHRLEVDLPADDLDVTGDAIRLAQVFSNLLNNAARYTPNGGTVRLAANIENDQVMVNVTDTGTGIEPHMLTSIFDMFVQATESSKAAQGGLGIGLTLVKSLVELHGGTVAAQSPGLGRGATFSVRLPVIPTAAPRLTADAAPAMTKMANMAKKQVAAGAILVVDDNEDAADSLAALLGSMGVVTLVAYNGEQALRLAEQHHPATVVLDIGMPGMDGYAIAQRLRAKQNGAALKLIALTGWGQQRDIERIETAGFDHHLLKPVDFPRLLALI